jgi:hypothetical protein
MSIIFSILKDELDRNQRMQIANQKELILYSKGCLVAKKRKLKTYYYLAFRNENNQIKTEYIGLENNPKVKELREHIEKRKEIISTLKSLSSEEEKIRKMMRHDR